MRRGLPFDVKIPNAETTEAMRRAESGEHLIEFAHLDDLKTRLS